MISCFYFHISRMSFRIKILRGGADFVISSSSNCSAIYCGTANSTFLPVDQTSSYWLVSTSNSSDFVYLLLNIYPKNDGRGNDCFNALDSATWD